MRFVSGTGGRTETGFRRGQPAMERICDSNCEIEAHRASCVCPDLCTVARISFDQPRGRRDPANTNISPAKPAASSRRWTMLSASDRACAASTFGDRSLAPREIFRCGSRVILVGRRSSRHGRRRCARRSSRPRTRGHKRHFQDGDLGPRSPRSVQDRQQCG